MKRFIALFTAIILTIILAPSAVAETEEDIRVPIIMYHKVSTNCGLLGKYCITPEEFEADLKYLQDHDYGVITITDLISFVHYGIELPKNPIVLTFDDGNYSDYRYVYPLLQKYNTRAVFSIIGSPTDEYTQENRQDINYPHLTWFQICEMMESGLIELQNHGYNLHSQQNGVQGAQKESCESQDEYNARLKEDVMKLQNRALEKTGIAPNTFTYPFGAYCPESDEALSDAGFYATLVCEERVNILKPGDTKCLFGLGRILRPHGTDPGAFFENIDVGYVID